MLNGGVRSTVWGGGPILEVGNTIFKLWLHLQELVDTDQPDMWINRVAGYFSSVLSVVASTPMMLGPRCMPSTGRNLGTTVCSGSARSNSSWEMAKA